MRRALGWPRFAARHSARKAQQAVWRQIGSRLVNATAHLRDRYRDLPEAKLVAALSNTRLTAPRPRRRGHSSANRLLTDHFLARRSRSRHLPGQHAQHDPGLLLNPRSMVVFSQARWPTRSGRHRLPASAGSARSSEPLSSKRTAAPPTASRASRTPACDSCSTPSSLGLPFNHHDSGPAGYAWWRSLGGRHVQARFIHLLNPHQVPASSPVPQSAGARVVNLLSRSQERNLERFGQAQSLPARPRSRAWDRP